MRIESNYLLRSIWVRRWIILAASLLVLSIVFIRIRLAPVPLERDEGGFAYIAQEVLKGSSPYEAGYLMHLPGLMYGYAAILSIFGQTAAGIHYGLLFIVLCTTIGLIILGGRLVHPWAGVLAGALYALFSLQKDILGFTASVEHFGLVFVVWGFVTLLSACQRQRVWRFLVAGLLFGIAFIMRQQVAPFLLLAMLLTILSIPQPSSLRRLGWFDRVVPLAAMMAVPLCALITIIALQGALEPFVTFTLGASLDYVSSNSLLPFVPYLERVIVPLVKQTFPIWVFALVGIGFLSVQKKNAQKLYILGMAVSAVAGMSIGFIFHPHYLQLLAPPVSLLAAAGVYAVWKVLGLRITHSIHRVAISGILALLLIGGTAALQWQYLFVWTPDEVSQHAQKNNYFSVYPRVGKYIASITGPNDIVGVVGSEPEINFYAQRRSASQHLYMYFFAAQRRSAEFADEFIRDIETADPSVLVFINTSASWNSSEDIIRVIDWADGYISENYAQVGIVELFSEDRVVYRLGDDASQPPLSEMWIGVYQRKAL